MSSIDKLRYHKMMFDEISNLIENKDNLISVKLWIRHNLNLINDVISKLNSEG
jgi:hypothetical protein